MQQLSAGLLFILMFNLSAYPVEGGEGNMVIQKGSQVTLDYTLIVDGEVIESSEGGAPLKYVHGQGKIIPGLARQLAGLSAGDKKRIEVAPQEAYGLVDPQAFQEVPRAQLPADLEPQVGMMLRVISPRGFTLPARIAELKPETVVIDFNHPLAGKTLIFEVKIISVE